MSEFDDKLQSILGNPDAMSQIMSIAQSITGNVRDGAADALPAEDLVPQGPSSQSAENPFSLLENLDPRLVQIGMRLLSEYNAEDDRKTALLTALQPFIREERCAKVDQAVRIARLAHVIRVALDCLRKGDTDLV